MNVARKLGVGIVGYEPGRSWAAMAHVPALRGLADYEIVGVATTRLESAEAAAIDIGIGTDRAFASAADLAALPDVDILAVTVKVPHHRELVRAAVAAGKHVYCEWPLGNGLAEAEEMTRLVSDAGVTGAIGLQARCAPAVAYVRDLVASGEMGEILASNMFATGIQWGDWVDGPNRYLLDGANGATLLSIPFGHSIDAMCFSLGEFTSLSATTVIRIPEVRLLETGEMLRKTVPDQIAVTGVLESGALANVHYRGGSSRGVNFAWEINGTKGDLRVEAAGGHAQMFELELSGAWGRETMKRLDIPEQHLWVPSEIGGLARNVAQAYSRLSEDLRMGTRNATVFGDAVVRHRLLETIAAAASTGERIRL